MLSIEELLDGKTIKYLEPGYFILLFIEEDPEVCSMSIIKRMDDKYFVYVQDDTGVGFKAKVTKDQSVMVLGGVYLEFITVSDDGYTINAMTQEIFTEDELNLALSVLIRWNKEYTYRWKLYKVLSNSDIKILHSYN